MKRKQNKPSLPESVQLKKLNFTTFAVPIIKKCSTAVPRYTNECSQCHKL